MNKKQQILQEAKRLFGQYGYLGFTLKQLAQACEMTSPALYYFYSSKADLFTDCLLSEMSARQLVIERCIEYSHSLSEFAGALAHEAIEVCDSSKFRTGQAMQEIIHLPEHMQEQLLAAWDEMLIAPVERFLDRVLPTTAFMTIPRRLIATYFINMATFSARHTEDYTHDELAALFVVLGKAIEVHASSTARE